MSSPAKLVAAPAAYVPLHALAFGAAGEGAVAVEGAHPLPVDDRAYRGAQALAPDVSAPAGRALAVDCARAGRATLVLEDGSELAVPLQVGLSVLPFAVSAVRSAGLTADAQFASLF